MPTAQGSRRKKVWICDERITVLPYTQVLPSLPPFNLEKAAWFQP